MKLCLNMIVKNEAGRIERALRSAVQFITCAVILDTGSTDDTVKVMESFFRHHKIPYDIQVGEFHDWSQARNDALSLARGNQERFGFDYILLMDADMELVVKDVDEFLKDRTGPAYDLMQHSGPLHYLNRRLLHGTFPGWYRGVTHEYLDVPGFGAIPEEVAYFVDHADGANRPGKYERDIRLLLAGLKEEPKNERYYFYLAQSYRDAGQFDKAIKWYKKRVDAGGWDEERWNAQVCLAHCYKAKEDEARFVSEMIKAYNMRPSRSETLYDLAHYYRNKGENAPAAMFAQVGMAIPRTPDTLFVNDYVYEVGLKEEFSIAGFYVPEDRERAFKVTDELALKPGPYGGARHLARVNTYYYLPKLGDLCKSFHSALIPFEAPENWIAMNPSIVVHRGRVMAIIRTVNYRVDENGCYWIRGTDGAANQTNPINTRNYLVELEEGKKVVGHALNPAETLPCKFPLVIGYEDMRLISREDGLHASATVRQFADDGMPEQVLVDITSDYQIANPRRMLRHPRVCEKNWMPVVRPDKSLLFIYRLGHAVDTEGQDVIVNPTRITVDHINGGGQLIRFMGGYLAIVHEAREVPGRTNRYYAHRFAYLGMDFQLLALSLPFVFHDKQIEFAAGLARHPKTQKILISYGVRDCEPWIGQIAEHDVMDLLWAQSK